NRCILNQKRNRTVSLEANRNPSCDSPNRRQFLTVGLASTLLVTPSSSLAASPHADNDALELSELSIADLQAGMQSGKYTSRSLAEKYLARIEAIDKQGPALRSVIEVNPDALALADELDK